MCGSFQASFHLSVIKIRGKVGFQGTAEGPPQAPPTNGVPWKEHYEWMPKGTVDKARRTSHNINFTLSISMAPLIRQA